MADSAARLTAAHLGEGFHVCFVRVATINASPNKVQLGLRVFRPRERLTDGAGEVTSNAASIITYDATIVWSSAEWRMREFVIVQ